MSRHITDETILMQRVLKMLPKGIPAEAINSVECDPYDGENGGPSYWVYLSNGYWCPTMGCHTIHEDTLSELRWMIREIEPWEDDPALEDSTKGYGGAEESEAAQAAPEGEPVEVAEATAEVAEGAEEVAEATTFVQAVKQGSVWRLRVYGGGSDYVECEYSGPEVADRAARMLASVKEYTHRPPETQQPWEV